MGSLHTGTVALLVVVVALGGLPALATAGPAPDIETDAPALEQPNEDGNVTAESVTFERVVFKNVTIEELAVDTLVTPEDELDGLIFRNLSASDMEFEDVTWASVSTDEEAAFGNLTGHGERSDATSLLPGGQTNDGDGPTVVVENVTIERLAVDTLEIRDVRRVDGEDRESTNDTRVAPVVVSDTRLVEELTVEEFRVEELNVACLCQKEATDGNGLAPWELPQRHVGEEQRIRELQIETWDAENVSVSDTSGGPF